MHKSEFALENETHKTVWNFVIQTDHITPAGRLDLMVINKKTVDLLSRWTTDCKSKKTKREISTSILPEN